MIDAPGVPLAEVCWKGARRIIRSLFHPLDVFEDIADPEDWPLLIAAEQKTNPRVIETLGALDLVPLARRVSGPGTTYLMAPFTHVSPDRPSRFTRCDYGVLYVAQRFETALLETMHHHACFMARTADPPRWTSQFRELVLDLTAELHDLRGGDPAWAAALSRDDSTQAQSLTATLRARGSEGIVYPSQHDPGGELRRTVLHRQSEPRRPRRPPRLSLEWARVDFYRDADAGEVFRVG